MANKDEVHEEDEVFNGIRDDISKCAVSSRPPASNGKHHFHSTGFGTHSKRTASVPDARASNEKSLLSSRVGGLGAGSNRPRRISDTEKECVSHAAASNVNHNVASGGAGSSRPPASNERQYFRSTGFGTHSNRTASVPDARASNEKSLLSSRAGGLGAGSNRPRRISDTEKGCVSHAAASNGNLNVASGGSGPGPGSGCNSDNSPAFASTENRHLGSGYTSLKPGSNAMKKLTSLEESSSEEENEDGYSIRLGSSISLAEKTKLVVQNQQKTVKTDFVDDLYPDLEEKQLKYKNAMSKLCRRKLPSGIRVAYFVDKYISPQVIHVSTEIYESSGEFLKFLEKKFGPSITVTYLLSESGPQNTLHPNIIGEAWKNFSPVLIRVKKLEG